MPFFSIIIPTRNRPTLFRRALDSAVAQSLSDTEIIVVDDGSSADHLSSYLSILGSVKLERVRLLSLGASPTGHGAGHARNHAAVQANADYLCFLDDDDCWTDTRHLERARAVLSQTEGGPIDLYLTNQAAFLNGVQKSGPIWTEDLPAILANRGSEPDQHGAHLVELDDLLRSKGFCHLNTLVVRRELFETVGGFDEGLRWEEDRDLYLRLIDRATLMKYMPICIARHHIPDPAKTANMSTALPEADRRLIQLKVFERAAVGARHVSIRSHALRYRAYTLKRLAECLSASGRRAEAADYARAALRAGPNIKWAMYTAWLTLRARASSIIDWHTSFPR